MSDLVYPLRFKQGSDFQPIIIFWTTGAPVAPVNLTGCTATLQMRQLATDGGTLVSISTTPNAQGLLVIGALAGSIAIYVFNAQTTLFPAGATGPVQTITGLWGTWDLEVLFPPNSIFSAGQKYPLATGPVWIDPQINR